MRETEQDRYFATIQGEHDQKIHDLEAQLKEIRNETQKKIQDTRNLIAEAISICLELNVLKAANEKT